MTRADSPASTFGFGVAGFVSVLLFSSSAMYHWSHRALDGMRRFDHTSIYLMIAGTFTPLCLLALEGTTRTAMLAIEWGCALIGVVSTLTMAKPPIWLRLTLYLTMGWITLPILGSLHPTLGDNGIRWMLAGGLVYTLGTVIYATKKPDPWPGVFGFHEIWHLFVMGGAACHYVMMLSL